MEFLKALVQDLFERVDVLAGRKTYILAGILALAVYLNLVGVLPDEALEAVRKVVEPLLGVTVGMRLARPRILG